MRYEFDGKRYQDSSAHQKEWGARLIGEFDLCGKERILDLGCGDGALTARLAELVPSGEVIGIDASQGMIDTARQHEARNLRFLLMDINKMPFSWEFDLLFSNATLHWILDHRSLLEKAHRALRAGGALRFNFAGEGNCSRFFTVIREAMARPEFSRCFSDFQWPWYMPTVEEYQRLMVHSPFREVRVWGENADRFFPDEEAMIKWVDQPSLVPFLACVNQADKADFRRFVVKGMIAATRQEDGRCFETFRRINVSAGK